MENYRIFVQDVGKDGYSGYKDVEASDWRAALSKVDRHGMLRDLIALPHSRRDLWPNGQTGRVPAEALKFRQTARARRRRQTHGGN